MAEDRDIILTAVDPITFYPSPYTAEDESAIRNTRVDTTFNPDTDYVEFYIYNQLEELFYPEDPNATIQTTNFEYVDKVGDTNTYYSIKVDPSDRDWET